MVGWFCLISKVNAWALHFVTLVRFGFSDGYAKIFG